MSQIEKIRIRNYVSTVSILLYAAEISMPDDGQTIYFGCGYTTTGHIQTIIH